MIERLSVPSPDTIFGMESTWKPSRLFAAEDHGQLYSIVLLNQAISKDHELLFETLWRRGESLKSWQSRHSVVTEKTIFSQASLRICADGAANRLYDTFQARGFVQLKQDGNSPHPPHEQGMIPPDEIVGDLDSLKNLARTFLPKALESSLARRNTPPTCKSRSREWRNTCRRVELTEQMTW